jgi:prepilin-type processing-associated H-X9-DG protein
MEFYFPPAPPGYINVIIARGLLVVWAIIGFAILIARIRRWKSLQVSEIGLWLFAAVGSGIVSLVGQSKYREFDNDAWLVPAMTAAFAVSAAGATVVLCKLYGDGSESEKTRVTRTIWLAAIVAAFGGSVLLIPTISCHGYGRTACKNNLKQIGLAMHNFHDIHQSFPASVGEEEPISWRIVLLPYLDQQQIFEAYDKRSPWNHPPNDKLALHKLPQYSCPSAYYPQDDRGRWFTAYSMLTGARTIGEKAKGQSLKDMTDGSSNTLMVVESCGSPIIWTEPRDINADSRPAGINLQGKTDRHSEGWLSSYHRGGANALLADGSVRFISEKADAALLNKLATSDGGEEVRSDEEW